MKNYPNGKGRRACNYDSGIWIPLPIPLWLPVDWAVRFTPISVKRKQVWIRNVNKHWKPVPMVVMSLLMSSPPISILHQLLRRRYSNSRDIVASWLLPFLPHRQSALERLLTGYMAAGGFISQLHCMAQHPVYQLTMTPLITLLGIQYYYCLGGLLHGNL